MHAEARERFMVSQNPPPKPEPTAEEIAGEAQRAAGAERWFAAQRDDPHHGRPKGWTPPMPIEPTPQPDPALDDADRQFLAERDRELRRLRLRKQPRQPRKMRQADQHARRGLRRSRYEHRVPRRCARPGRCAVPGEAEAAEDVDDRRQPKTAEAEVGIGSITPPGRRGVTLRPTPRDGARAEKGNPMVICEVPDA
jgi:hypothetical protein